MPQWSVAARSMHSSHPRQTVAKPPLHCERGVRRLEHSARRAPLEDVASAWQQVDWLSND
jgi:hypothetical protein